VLIANTYFIDYLPSQLHWRDVGVTVLIASLLTLLASLYPARAAAQIEAAQHLH
jgi:lipoprotein-releasing system permease protein